MAWPFSRKAGRHEPKAAAEVPLANAVSQAAGLAESAPIALLEARRLAASVSGVHGRRRAGEGETFWQFRDHRPEDGARAVDWRRSARGDRLYVRERELEAAQTAWIWVDPAPSFAWSSDGAWPQKRHRALVVTLALAMALTRGGERAGALGAGPPMRGAQTGERLAYALAHARADAPPTARSALVYASDFYDPAELWRVRMQAAASAGAHGALLVVSDPAEEEFPFEGRTAFEPVRAASDRLVLGRPELARGAYLERLAAHRATLKEMAHRYGFFMIMHRTDRAAGPALSALIAGLGAKT